MSTMNRTLAAGLLAGAVMTLDVGIVLGNWTPQGQTCGDCENEDLCCECHGDIDLDCKVGITDFLKIVATWGPCPGFGAPCPQGGAAAGSGLSLEQAVQQLGFTSIGGFQTWLADADPDEAYGMVQLLAVLLSE
jgi:hypothetical protein